ncbi:MAG TPA: phosphate ABC transporter permease PstA [Bacteroidia bacterium]|jgi:phosphate transport system permease protein|nr:phosphate ABC transporter permease PstA [Bacteroidia bacterium]
MDHSEKLAKQKKRNQAIAFGILKILSFSIVLILISILIFIVYNGISVLNWDFLTQMPEDGMTKGGIYPAIVGTLYLVGMSMLFAFPIGLLAGVYINEYAKEGWIKKTILFMTSNLAGIPSVVFGIFGMALFVNKFGFGDSILSASLTLALMALPIVTRVTQEALKAVDPIHRQGSAALGATKWQTTRRVVLPIALPNIMTGLILSIGRVSGETAPILFTGVVYSLKNLPSSIFEPTMALPYHLFAISTSNTNIEASRPRAYATALVLILIVLFLNLLANILRKFFGKRVKMH